MLEKLEAVWDSLLLSAPGIAWKIVTCILVLIIGNVQNVILIWGIMKLPKMFPEHWAKSPFHVSDGVFKGCLLAAIAVTLVQFYMNVSGTTMTIVIINAVTMVVAAAFAVTMKKSGKVHMEVSYELA